MRGTLRRPTGDGVLDLTPEALAPSPGSCLDSLPEFLLGVGSSIEDALRAKHRRPALSVLEFCLLWKRFLLETPSIELH